MMESSEPGGGNVVPCWMPIPGFAATKHVRKIEMKSRIKAILASIAIVLLSHLMAFGQEALPPDPEPGSVVYKSAAISIGKNATLTSQRTFNGKRGTRINATATLFGRDARGKPTPLAGRQVNFLTRWYDHGYRPGTYDNNVTGVTDEKGEVTVSLRIPSKAKVAACSLRIESTGDASLINNEQYRSAYFLSAVRVSK